MCLSFLLPLYARQLTDVPERVQQARKTGLSQARGLDLPQIIMRNRNASLNLTPDFVERLTQPSRKEDSWQSAV
jgi:hypothetical protein